MYGCTTPQFCLADYPTKDESTGCMYCPRSSKPIKSDNTQTQPEEKQDDRTSRVQEFLRKKFTQETGIPVLNSQGEYDIDYVNWLEDKLLEFVG